ncbi:MAG: hypothetical protein ABSG57_06195 [Candidatus Bathyarchaeia archaeon]
MMSIVLSIAAGARTLPSPGLHRMLEAQNGIFLTGMASAFASRSRQRKC